MRLNMDDIVIVGGGIAGHQAASTIRQLAPHRRIRVVNAELGLPYERPRLSKEFLTASQPPDPTLGQSRIYDGGVELTEGVTAQAIDREKKKLALSDGSSVTYRKLLLATGSALRRLALPDVGPDRIFYLRTLADAVRLRRRLRDGCRVAVIGGGYVGLEVAAAALQQGCKVSILEAQPALLLRSATAFLADFVYNMFVGRGAEIMLGARLEEAREDADGILLRCGDRDIRADIAVVGIGVAPNVSLAMECGLEVADGITVDRRCRTADEDIYAAGEVTNYPIGEDGLRIRTESWSSASSQAIVAAKNMVGIEASFNEMPWFWSDQFDTNIQCLGLPRNACRYLHVGDPASSSWLRVGVDGTGRLVGAEAVNFGRAVSELRRAQRNGMPIPSWIIEKAAARTESL